MGRKVKEGLDYFYLDTTFGDKVNYLLKKGGLESYAIFVLLLRKIYGIKGYYARWDDKNQVLFCENGITLEKLKLTVSICLEIGLFDQKSYERFKILTSEVIQTTYFEVIKASKRKGISISSEFKLENPEEKAISSEEKPIYSGGNQHTEMNGNEMKGNEVSMPSENNTVFVDPEEAKQVIDTFRLRGNLMTGKVSDFFKKEFTRTLHDFKYKDDLPDIFAALDEKGLEYEFRDHNHLRNTFFAIHKDILEERKKNPAGKVRSIVNISEKLRLPEDE